MTKRLLTIGALVLVLLLVVPLPTGVYKDGGTREYTALTYKVVRWNRLTAGNTFSATRVYPFPLNFRSINALWEREQPTESAPPTDDHTPAATPHTVEDPITVWCGNTIVTVKYDGRSYTFWGGDSVALTALARNTAYDPDALCDCVPTVTVLTEFGDTYGISPEGAYIRCAEGQASLTAEQVDMVRDILSRLDKQDLIQ